MNESANGEGLKRLHRVQTLMARDGYNALLVSDNDDMVFLPGGHTRYLAHFAVGVHSRMVIVVPRVGEPTLILPPGPLNCLPEMAKHSGWIQKVRSTSLGGWPARQDWSGDVKASLQASGIDRGKVGWCGEIPDLENIRKQLPSIQFVAAQHLDSRGISRDLMEEARSLKTPVERETLVRAQNCADIGIQAFINTAAPGVRNNRAIAEADYQAKVNGSEETFTAMSSGHHPFGWWITRGDLKFSAGDLVSLEFNARVDGYVAQIARSFTLGKPNPRQAAVLRTAREALLAMEATMKPGATGNDLWNAAKKVVDANGLGMWGRFGHGMGMCMAEHLDVMPGDTNVVQEGQCIMLHAGIVDERSRDMALIGDQYFIERAGAVPLSPNRLPHETPAVL